MSSGAMIAAAAAAAVLVVGCQRDAAEQVPAAAIVEALELRTTGPNDPKAPAVVLLHGFGASGDDLVGLADALQPAVPGVRFVIPAGPVAAGPGAAWWSDPEKPAGAAAARAKVTRVLDQMIAGGTQPSDIVVAGFSQGSVLAMDVALHYPEALAGVAMLSSYAVLEESWAALLPRRVGLGIYMSHGTHDSTTPASWALGFADRLRGLGYDVRLVSFPGGHAISKAAFDGLAVFLRDQLPER